MMVWFHDEVLLPAGDPVYIQWGYWGSSQKRHMTIAMAVQATADEVRWTSPTADNAGGWDTDFYGNLRDKRRMILVWPNRGVRHVHWLYAPKEEIYVAAHTTGIQFVADYGGAEDWHVGQGFHVARQEFERMERGLKHGAQ